MPKTTENLVRWAAEHGVASPGSPAVVVTYAHLHLPGTPSAECPESPCKALGVCRALFELYLESSSPLKDAVRLFAQAFFDIAGECDGLASRLRQLAKEHDGSGVLAKRIGELTVTAAELRVLDELIRAECLSERHDVAPRGKRRAEGLTLALMETLERAGFSAAEIQALIEDGGSADATRRAKAVQRRLQRHRGQRWSMKHAKVPDR